MLVIKSDVAANGLNVDVTRIRVEVENQRERSDQTKSHSWLRTDTRHNELKESGKYAR
jgi:hypothetical protein